MTTLVHTRVEMARAGTNPTVICRMSSGWAVLCDAQYLRGYAILLADPIVPDLNALANPPRASFLCDMGLLGDALLEVTGAYRINYAIMGNLDPAMPLHAHVIPRYASEPDEYRTGTAWNYPKSLREATPFDPTRDKELMENIAEAIRRRSQAAGVKIIPYETNWPAEFRQIAARLRAGLGDLALRIDHIGSTAVPGLPAKDVIDIQITVAALDEQIIAAMTALGYSLVQEYRSDHRPPNSNAPDVEWEKLLFSPPAGQRRTHTHVRVQGRANQRYPLLFRDYLRTHPATAAAYAELKRRLAQHLADPHMYPEVKDPAVDLIYLAAQEWAAVTGWQPGPGA